MARIKYLDFLKFLLIFIVVFNHSIQAYTSLRQSAYDVFVIYSTSFNMQLFMMVSGMFLASTFKKSWKVFFLKKARQLLLPTLSCYFVYKVIMCIAVGKAFSFDLLAAGYFLWFLTCLFICLSVCWIFKKALRNDLVAALLSIAFVMGIRYFNYCYINSMLFFVWCGYFLMKHMEWVKSHATILLCVAFVASCVLLPFYSFDRSFYGTPTQFISMHDFDLQNLLWAIYRLATGFSVSSLVLLLVMKLCGGGGEKASKFLGFLSLVGTETLGIYAVQKIVVEVLIKMLDLQLGWVAAHVGALLTAMVVCVGTYWLIRKTSRVKLLATLFYGK